jgi:type II secretory pathway predicted ATPase ExeA
MYEEFYGLREKAFSKTPDPRFLYLSEAHQEALAQLEYAVEEKEIAVLTGEIGTGKTLISRALMDRLDDESYVIANVINPALRPAGFLRVVAQELGVNEPGKTKRELIDQLQALLLQMNEQAKTPVVLVDESQLIPGKDVFDEIRLLTNFQLDTENLISIIFIGQPELATRLKKAPYRPLAQRIGAECHLGPLETEDTGKYLEHRLRTAGASRSIFDEGAKQAVHARTKGTPRAINNLATQCLLEGFARENEVITAPTVEKVAQSMRFL